MKLEAVQDNNLELVSEILGVIRGLTIRDDSATELLRILQQPHFQVRNYSMIITFRCLFASPLILSFCQLLCFHVLVSPGGP